MNFRIIGPKNQSKPGNKKKRTPLDIAEAIPNVIGSKWVAPLAMVITLYGKGVTPKKATIQAPISL